MIEQKSKHFSEFLKAMDEQVASCIAPEEQVAKVCGLLSDLVTKADVLDMSQIRPNPDHYARYCLYKHPQNRYCVVCMVWGPGQSTGIHDHDGCWCVESIYRNKVRITRFDLKARSDEICRFEQGDTSECGVGAVGNLIPPSEFHRVENCFDQPAISIHVYGHELTKCNRYVPSGDGVHHTCQTVSLSYDG